VDRADPDLIGADQLGEAPRLRAGKGEIQLRGDAALEYVDMFGQSQDGLHHVQVVDLFGVEACKRAGEKIRLLLVVAFEADAVAGLQHGFEQCSDIGGGDFLAFRQGGGAGEPRLSAARLNVPVSHGKTFQ
jgi:hypothetical protein